MAMEKESYLERYTEYLKNTKKMAENSYNAYRRDVSEFQKYLSDAGVDRPEDITNTDIVSYILSLRKSGRAPSTVNRKIASVRSYCSFLCEEGVLDDNPAREIKVPHMEHRELEYLTVEEVERILSAPDQSVKGIRDRSILEIMDGPGIRVTEITSLHMSDVNFRIGFITCSGEYGKARIIPLGRPCRRALERYVDEARPKLLESYRKRQRAFQTESAGAEAEPDYLFMNYHGQKLTRQGLWKIVRTYADKAGIQGKLTPQILRNSFAAHMVQNGADLKSIQELMGYEDAAAAQIYLSVSRNRIKEVYDRTHPRA